MGTKCRYDEGKYVEDIKHLKHQQEAANQKLMDGSGKNSKVWVRFISNSILKHIIYSYETTAPLYVMISIDSFHNRSTSSTRFLHEPCINF